MLSFLLILFCLIQQPMDLCGCEDKPQVNTLAVVNGVKITKQELGSDAQNRISLLQNEVIKARSAELDLQINRLLLEAEAKRRGITSEQLLQLEIATRVPEPTEAEARAFYDERKKRMAEDFKTARPKIIALLKTERERLAALKLAAELRAAANIVLVNQNVTPPTNEEELNRVFARVNGRNITSRDIEANLRPLIFKVQEQVYAARKDDLDLRINDMLLEQEAKRQNVSPAILLARAIKPKLPIITDQQAKAFYDQNKTNLHGNFAKVKFQIIQFLMQREEDKLSKAFAAELRQNSAVQIYLTPPGRPTGSG